jgi:hypothetical protein
MRVRLVLCLFIIGIAVSLAMTISRSRAQGAQCGPLEGILDKLQNEYHERIEWEGVGPNGSQVLLFQSDAGSWTLLVVHGVMGCMMAAGTDGTGKVTTGLGA